MESDLFFPITSTTLPGLESDAGNREMGHLVPVNRLLTM